MDKLRKIFAAAMICLVVSAIATYALSPHNFPMETPTTAVPIIKLYAQNGTLIPEGIAYFNWIIPVSVGSTINFTAKNDGNLIASSVSLTIDSFSACTAHLNDTSTFSLGSGEARGFQIVFDLISGTPAQWIIHVNY